MARLTFKTVNMNTIETMQKAVDTIFATSLESDTLSKARKTLAAEFAKIENPTDEQKLENTKADNVLVYKMKAVRSYYKETMEGETGLYNKLGVMTMVDGQELGARNKNLDLVKQVLTDTYGFSVKADKLVGKLATIICDAIGGLDESTRSQTLKGQLTRDRKSRKLYEVAMRTIAEYAEKSIAGTLSIKTKEFYEVKFNYEKDSLRVTDYEITQIDTIE